MLLHSRVDANAQVPRPWAIPVVVSPGASW